MIDGCLSWPASSNRLFFKALGNRVRKYEGVTLPLSSSTDSDSTERRPVRMTDDMLDGVIDQNSINDLRKALLSFSGKKTGGKEGGLSVKTLCLNESEASPLVSALKAECRRQG